MKKLLTTAAIALLLTGGITKADREFYEYRDLAKKGLTAAELANWEADSHGYATAAEMDYCHDVVEVTDPALREKWDRKYRYGKRYAETYLEGFMTIGMPGSTSGDMRQLLRCSQAVTSVPWLSFKPGALEMLKEKVEEGKATGGYSKSRGDEK